MKLCTVYKTSKGVFWNRADAEKKVNRAKVFGSHPGDPVELESVCESFVLVDGNLVFSLSTVEVK